MVDQIFLNIRPCRQSVRVPIILLPISHISVQIHLSPVSVCFKYVVNAAFVRIKAIIFQHYVQFSFLNRRRASCITFHYYFHVQTEIIISKDKIKKILDLSFLYYLYYFILFIIHILLKLHSNILLT